MTSSSRLPPLARLWLGAAGLYGCSGIVIAALLAHRSSSLPPAAAALARTALEIQMWHALALLALAALTRGDVTRRLLTLAGVGFIVGSLAFCGAVYAAALAMPTGVPVAPFGGTVLILSWAVVVMAALRG